MIAYFSMEIALAPQIPTYSGGLGILAGDTLRSAADLSLPMVAVSLLYKKGYFYQRLLPDGWQTEEPVEWVVKDSLRELPSKLAVQIDHRKIQIKAWKYEIVGKTSAKVPVYLLDTDLPENTPDDRSLTHSLYGGDLTYRLNQEIILGIGGVRLLRALGLNDINRFHMNEGHAAFLTLELLEEEKKRTGLMKFDPKNIQTVREKCVFTTHTPVPAGHDKFPIDMVSQALGYPALCDHKDILCHEDKFNMTYLALNLSHYVNGVAKKHGEVSRHMFSSYSIDSITNGVHASTWVCPPLQELFNRHIPGWEEDNFNLRYALSIPKNEIWDAHMEAKKNLISFVNKTTNTSFDLDVFTLGFARRAATYKRADLLFLDPERLCQIASNAGPIQILYAGKAHPADHGGKEIIKKIFKMKNQLKSKIKIVYLENYAMDLGKQLTSGVDLWLNTPKPPLEASGTSGMKASLNGIPNLSVMDGWWIEGCIEGKTGWAIGSQIPSVDYEADTTLLDAQSLYEKLEKTILPLFYKDRNEYIEIMRHSIALNGSFFNTQRMVQQYVLKAYF
ncbi:alpha-glucan phosphorylase [bacterium F11]|nr:alpha-glucan phosphorylase [bacterium F11]